MNKKDRNILIIIGIFFVSINMLKYMVNFDNSLFLGFLEGVSSVINLLALVFVALQLRYSDEQVQILKEQETRNKSADLRIQLIGSDNSFFYIKVFNIGINIAYDINLNIIGHSKKNKDAIDDFFINYKEVISSNNRTKKVNKKFKNEIILSSEFIEVIIPRINIQKYDKLEFNLSFRDNSTNDIKEYSYSKSKKEI